MFGPRSVHGTQLFKNHRLFWLFANAIREEPGQGRVFRIRRALELSVGTVAKKVGISSSAYVRLERKDADGTIRLHELRQIAEALGAEVEIRVRMKCGRDPREIVWDRALEVTRRLPFAQGLGPHERPRKLARLVAKLLRDTGYRKHEGLAQRRHHST